MVRMNIFERDDFEGPYGQFAITAGLRVTTRLDKNTKRKGVAEYEPIPRVLRREPVCDS